MKAMNSQTYESIQLAAETCAVNPKRLSKDEKLFVESIIERLAVGGVHAMIRPAESIRIRVLADRMLGR